MKDMWTVYSLKRLSISASVISAKGDPIPGRSALRINESKILLSSSDAFFERSLTRPRLTIVKNDHQDHSGPDDRHIEGIPSSLVKLVGELVFTDQLCQTTHRGNIACGE